MLPCEKSKIDVSMTQMYRKYVLDVDILSKCVFWMLTRCLDMYKLNLFIYGLIGIHCYCNFFLQHQVIKIYGMSDLLGN